MTLTATDLVPALAQYADRFHGELADEDRVASPLGAWLLLALATPAARGADRAALERVRGVDAKGAAATAAALLADPYLLVLAATAVWPQPDVVPRALNRWLHRPPCHGRDRQHAHAG